MIVEEINKYIAQWCGWQWKHDGNDEDPEWFLVSPDKNDDSNPPDYYHDLNAMHEAEKLLTPIQQSCYSAYLGDWATFEKGEYPTFSFLHATAAQRAEALLKTVGLWEEYK